MRTNKPWIILMTVLAPTALLVAACGSDSDSGASSDTTEQSADDMGNDTATTEAPDAGSDDAMTDDMVTPVGDACEAIPADGEGSSAGMADDTAGTAASNNPVLSTLVKAAGEADLVDALNDPNATYTIFAPANSAFDKIPADQLEAVLADTDLLTDILTYHVYADGQLDLDGITEEGTLTMLNGDTVEVAADGETAKINGESVVVCGNVTTSNATVHIIDTVLMPAEG